MSNVLAQKTTYDAAVRLYMRSGQSPFPHHEHLNHRRELNAARAMMTSRRESAQEARLIAFGPAGNGKRAFVQALCNELAAAHSYNVVWVDTRDLTLRDEEFIRYEIDALHTFLSSASLRPLALAVDDADCFVSSDRKDLARAERRAINERLENRKYAADPALLAIAESPLDATREMDPLDKRKFSFLYFGWPDHVRMAEVLDDAHIPTPGDVARCLKDLEAGRKVRFTLSSIVNAAREAPRLKGSIVDAAGEALRLKGGTNAYSAMAAQDIAEELSHFCNPTPKEKVREYEKRNASYIEKASEFLREWSTPPSP